MSPRRPGVPCKAPMCPEVIPAGSGGYCERHKAQAPRYSQTRGQRRPGAEEQDDFHNSKRWRRFREWHLAQNPLCIECEKAGRVEAATIVDHIVPISEGGEEMSSDNAQSLCKSCHSKKTNAERKR